MCQLLASGISLHSSFDHLKQLLIGDIHFVFTMVKINIVIYIEHDDLITKPESTAISTDICYTLDMDMKNKIVPSIAYESFGHGYL